MSAELPTWSAARFAEAIFALGQESGLAEAAHTGSVQGGSAPAADELNFFITEAAAAIGLEAVPAPINHRQALELLLGVGPAVIPVHAGEEVRLVLVLGARRRRLLLLGPDRRIVRAAPQAVVQLLRAPLEARLKPALDALLTRARLSRRGTERAREGLIVDQLKGAPIGTAFSLRLPPGASFARQFRLAGLGGSLVGFLGLQLVAYMLGIGSWWLIGQGALRGSIDQGYLLAWMLLLLSLVPFGYAISWSQGVLTIGVGALLKRRLLQGIMRLMPDEMRREGAGQSLGRVIESQALETLALGAGVSSVMAVVELILSAGILSLGAGGLPHALLFGLWLGITLALGLRYYRRRLVWTEERLRMTDDLVESLVGHRTRLTQERRDRWHLGEDEALSGYLERSADLDRAATRLKVLVLRAWLPVGLVGLAPVFIAGEESVGRLALSVGGLIMARQALDRLAMSLEQITGAAIAWRQSAPLYRAAARPIGTPAPEIVAAAGFQRGRSLTRTLLEACDLNFRYRPESQPVLEGCDLRVQDGDRILLEGPSGGGKSTLGAILAGLREPLSGLVLMRGFDQKSLGAAGWRRRVVLAPQFQENLVFTGTLAFNLLMGRRWPASGRDVEEAETVARELGLGPLIERMPSGMNQIVGETGWQLSHGERSRVYIARALLQDADLVLLDESFAALDPESFHVALDCALRRARSLIVIAHV